MANLPGMFLAASLCFMFPLVASAGSPSSPAIPSAVGGPLPFGEYRLQRLTEETATPPQADAEQSPTLMDQFNSGTDQVVAKAEQVKRTFREELLGKSISAGIGGVGALAVLRTSQGTFESYNGPDALTPAVAFNSSSAHGLVVREEDIGRIHFTDTLNFVANYAQFNANRQTIQRVPGGQTGSGFVRGSFVYGAALAAYNGIYEGSDIDLAFRIGVGIGAALSQFDGRVDYTVAGRGYSDTFSHGYDQPMIAFVIPLDIRVGHTTVNVQAVRLFGNVRTDKAHTNFESEIDLVSYSIGYVFYL